MIPTTVTISLTSPTPTSKQARNGGKKGWNRFVVRTDRSQKGAYMLVSDGDAFAPEGEQVRNVGDVFVMKDCDGDYGVFFVAHDGKKVMVRDSFGHYWLGSTMMVSLCDRIDRTLKMPYRERLVQRLAVAEACSDEPDQVEVANRVRSLIAEIDEEAWPAEMSAKDKAIEQIKALALEHGIDLSTL